MDENNPHLTYVDKDKIKIWTSQNWLQSQERQTVGSAKSPRGQGKQKYEDLVLSNMMMSQIMVNISDSKRFVQTLISVSQSPVGITQN